jgi:hypothetical protein
MALEDYTKSIKNAYNQAYDKANRWLPGSGNSVPLNTVANIVFHGMALYLVYNAYQERSVMFTAGLLVGVVGTVPTIGMRSNYARPIAAKAYNDFFNPAIGAVIRGIYLLAMSAALYSFSVAPKKTALCVGIVTGALIMDAILVAGVRLDQGLLKKLKSAHERVAECMKSIFGKDNSTK